MSKYLLYFLMIVPFVLSLLLLVVVLGAALYSAVLTIADPSAWPSAALGILKFVAAVVGIIAAVWVCAAFPKFGNALGLILSGGLFLAVCYSIATQLFGDDRGCVYNRFYSDCE